MKKILWFITHKTLNQEHALATLDSLWAQEGVWDKFDKMYIYNTHPDEIDNAWLVEKAQSACEGIVVDIAVFPYDPATPKSLGADIFVINEYMKNNYSAFDRYLLLKSDCVLSKNYLNEIFNLEGDGFIYFVAPFVCAKARVTDEEIFEYAQRDRYIRSDPMTFFVEDKNNSPDNDFTNRAGYKITDEAIKFTSCEVIGDFSCHYLSVGINHLMITESLTWGGVKFYNLKNYHVGSDRCFVIHKYHGIISENRATDREGPVSGWLNS